MLERTIPKMIVINTRLATELPFLQGDPGQLEQVLVNLVTNAVDAMDASGRLLIKTSQVEMDGEYEGSPLELSPGRYLLLEVSDSGCGMDHETLCHIFEPFFTTKEVDKGTGLWLSTVYDIGKAHGGHVICESEEGRGAVFQVYLPAFAGEHTVEEEQPAPVIETMPSGQGETILVVDDEPAILEAAQAALEQAGYRVLIASSGEHAMGVYSRQGVEIDLVILELGMPGMGGVRCLEELLKMDSQARVMVTSGYSSEQPVKDTLRIGAREFLPKPYRLDRLLETVKRILAS